MEGLDSSCRTSVEKLKQIDATLADLKESLHTHQAVEVVKSELIAKLEQRLQRIEKDKADSEIFQSVEDVIAATRGQVSLTVGNEAGGAKTLPGFFFNVIKSTVKTIFFVDKIVERFSAKTGGKFLGSDVVLRE